LDPLQQEAEILIEKLQEKKGRLSQEQDEIGEMLKEHMTRQDVEILVEMSVQPKKKVTDLEKKFHALEVALHHVN
jgi:predicted nuclease with TOPRIM domain